MRVSEARKLFWRIERELVKLYHNGEGDTGILSNDVGKNRDHHDGWCRPGQSVCVAF